MRRMAQTEHALHCLVRKTSNTQHLEEAGATLIMGDVTDRGSLLEGMKGCDWVINLANIYTFWEPDKKIYMDVNVEVTRNVMECALETGVSKVVHVSTALVYGKPADCPFTEESPVGPVRFSEYARTKYEGELVAWDLYEKQGLPLVVIYPGSVLGPGDPKATGQHIKNLIHRRVRARAFENVVTTYVHVRDVAEVIVRALEKQSNIGERYLVGKHQFSFREYDELISQISGVPLPSIRLPDAVAIAGTALLTRFADLIKKPPPWGISTDGLKTVRAGLVFDGSKAERELGITYTPIQIALEEAIASFK